MKQKIGRVDATAGEKRSRFRGGQGMSEAAVPKGYKQTEVGVIPDTAGV
jgi:hypothetical protein